MRFEPTPLDWHALEAVHDHFIGRAMELCAQDEHPPVLIAVRARANGQVLGSMPFPAEVIARLFEDEAGKAQMARLLLDLVADTPMSRATWFLMGFVPDVLVQIHEAWWVMRPSAPAVRQDLSQAPDRRECLVISLHTRAGTVPVMHEIVAEPTRHVVRAPFPAADAHGQWTGRFIVAAPPRAGAARP